MRKHETIRTKKFAFLIVTLWNCSGPYFLVFGPDTGKYEAEKKSVFGHFLRSVVHALCVSSLYFICTKSIPFKPLNFKVCRLHGRKVSLFS